MQLSRSFAAAAVAAVVVGGTIAAVTVPEGSPGIGTSTPPLAPSEWRGLVGAQRTTISLGQRVIVLLAAPSLADHVRLAGGSATDVQERRWTSAVLAGQEQFLAKIASKGVIARPALRFTRVVNGFSAIADPRAVALLERSPDVRGVFPVRAAYPAALSETAATGSALPSGLVGYRGRGVTVALLDTAVDPASPFLHGRVLPGFDLVDGGAAARYDQRPGGGRLETHGTETAGIVAGLGAPGRPQGLASEVTVLPIRVAGWQRDLSGRWAQYARTDQVIAGLERAVDPNRDGDAHDAARISLVPLAEPFAAFADGPLADASSGAADARLARRRPGGKRRARRSQPSGASPGRAEHRPRSPSARPICAPRRSRVGSHPRGAARAALPPARAAHVDCADAGVDVRLVRSPARRHERSSTRKARAGSRAAQSSSRRRHRRGRWSGWRAARERPPCCSAATSFQSGTSTAPRSVRCRFCLGASGARLGCSSRDGSAGGRHG